MHKEGNNKSDKTFKISEKSNKTNGWFFEKTNNRQTSSKADKDKKREVTNHQY